MVQKNIRKKLSKLVKLFFLIMFVIGITLFIKDFDILAMNNTIMNKPNVFTDIDKTTYKYVNKDICDINTGELILINNSVKYKFPDKNNLLNVFNAKNKSYKVLSKSIRLEENVILALNSMLSDFKEKSKINDVCIISGFRTYEYQEKLFKSKVSDVGEKEASMWTAVPAGSEHHTGYALDFCIYTDQGKMINYKGNGKYKWINNNSYKYGFIVRYLAEKTAITKISDEPWHFRYVGKPHAYLIKQMDFCFEEYIDYIRKFEFGKQHLKINDGNKQYEIYFVKANKQTKVPVPKDKKYTISGNNVDGFIITVEL